MTAVPRVAMFAIAAAVLTANAQEHHDLERILGRLGAYLTSSEAALGSLVADELYFQRQTTGNDGKLMRTAQITTRRLDSEVAFLRLPGGG